MSNHNQVEQVRTGGVAVQVVLWLVLAASCGVNALGQFFGLENVWRLAAGGVGVLCVVLLVVFHLRRRSR